MTATTAPGVKFFSGALLAVMLGACAPTLHLPGEAINQPMLAGNGVHTADGQMDKFLWMYQWEKVLGKFGAIAEQVQEEG
ncbi:MAG: hypothetical protein CFH02_01777 [Alphaproteobacteria bacterium MarineAlpha3_Bin1]|nr:MAG: hypothetical protein CFH02_01777 [Alphaproteobacteria bacterium MarineAlpha3_Bin1]